MKKITLLLLVTCAFCFTGLAQPYSINWYNVTGGGGTSSGNGYSLSGTVGQPDASGTLTGGGYSLTGGFWAFLTVVQTPGAPTLYVTHSGSTVTIYWQNMSGWVLQQNNNLTTPAGWSGSGTPTLTNGTNYLTINPSTGNFFFRLANP